jgi:arginine/lysine/ornithine decarboxylase
MQKEGKERLKSLIKTIQGFKKEIKEATKFIFLEKLYSDSTRVVINTNGIDITGYDLYKILEEKYNIICEMADNSNIVLIPSVCNDISDFDRLKLALIEIDKNFDYSKKKEYTNYNLIEIPKLYVDMRTAFFSNKKVVKTECCLGRICAEVKCIFPPGIPFLLPGQIIDDNFMSILQVNNISEVLVMDLA